MDEFKEEKRTIKTKDNTSQDNFSFKENIIRILKGSVLAIVSSIFFLTIYAIILTYTNMSENSIFSVVFAIVGISILIGSYLSSRKIQQNGILNGAVVGLIYMILLYVISSAIFMDFSLNMNSIIMIVVGIIAGIIGGIIGVNVKK